MVIVASPVAGAMPGVRRGINSGEGMHAWADPEGALLRRLLA